MRYATTVLAIMMAPLLCAAPTSKEVSGDGYAGTVYGDTNETDNERENKRVFTFTVSGKLTGNTDETRNEEITYSQNIYVEVQLCPKESGEVGGRFHYSQHGSGPKGELSIVVDGSILGNTDENAEMPDYSVQFSSSKTQKLKDGSGDIDLSIKAQATVPTVGEFHQKIALLRSKTSGFGSEAEVQGLGFLSAWVWQKADEFLQRSHARWQSGGCVQITLSPEKPILDKATHSEFQSQITRTRDNTPIAGKLSVESVSGAELSPRSCSVTKDEPALFQLQGNAQASSINFELEASSREGRATTTSSPTLLDWVIHVKDSYSYQNGPMQTTVTLDMEARNTSGGVIGDYVGSGTSTTTQEMEGALSVPMTSKLTNLKLHVGPYEPPPLATSDSVVAPLETVQADYSGTGTVSVSSSGTGTVSMAGWSTSRNISAQKHTTPLEVRIVGDKVRLTVKLPQATLFFDGEIRGEPRTD